MTTNRRTLLEGMTGAALLAPCLAIEKAMAAQAAGGAAAPSANPSAAEQTAMHDKHMEAMNRVLGPGLWGQEQIAMLLYPKFTALDLVGPHYFFACLFGAKVHLVTTEKDLSPVTSDLGLAITPTVTMADAPKDLDLLFVPGGTEGTLSVMARADTMAWIRDRASRAKHITSVCTGSMVLAKAGLLKGKRATSHWVARDILADFGAIPVNERVVKDGNILTGAGVSAGLDFAIAMVEQLRGRAYAEALVLQGEYAPDPSIKGGTLATTSAPVGEMMSEMFAPVASMFRAMAES
ncbi:DJ-1/PfpI family protein [Novosphingobium olei]|uniref:DJ-1/PfpI family protein n=1 Tax=Novosphingobium olei TaxID=2728851 RepID=A0A7Y0GAV1_9SPHN|nr:DJ-1/PfpI family protein [Novosphingobium olei]NML93997.1 DJ-1/PfpI family protein [Novosphingobium olei]